MIKDKEYSNKVLKLIREYPGTKHDLLVNEAIQAYMKRDYGKIDEVIAKLPSDYKLLSTLIEKLKGKSVYSGLKALLEGKDQSIEQSIISTSSLITHVGIELKENKEYKKLLPDLYTKLGILITKL